MPKTKAGEQITWKEYVERWKRGIEGITPLQQTNIQIRGSYIIILGLLCGIFITTLNFKDLWWLCLILVGGLFNSAMQWVGLYQKKRVLSKLYDLDVKGFNEPKPKVTERKGMGDLGYKFEERLKDNEKVREVIDKGIEVVDCSNEGTPFEDKRYFVEDNIDAKYKQEDKNE